MALRSLVDLPAPAKLNVFLHVVGRRADGYHLLQSLFVLIDWADVLHVERREDGRLHRHDLGPPLPEDDLCLRAARLLQQASGCTLGADISIDKHVPSGAGMGGGSSDAATVLLALNRLWGLHWPRARLLTLAPRLGADVPFFVGGLPAFVEGIGDVITPLPVARRRYAVVKPAASLPTAAIFTSPMLVRDTEPAILTGFLADAIADDSKPGFWPGIETEGLERPGLWGRNDLQPVAEGLCPDVVQALDGLRQRHGHARMTGSGSAVFATPPEMPDAGRDASVLPQATRQAAWFSDELPPGWVGRWCRSLDSHPLRDWAG